MWHFAARQLAACLGIKTALYNFCLFENPAIKPYFHSFKQINKLNHLDVCGIYLIYFNILQNLAVTLFLN
ncbi:hypothetical protein AU255_17885 [Methyloprofundus sedimenti]|uniref:Uncharacterized protein n=1 Tax=Methyloprofundus sedimenti TaxID=1420851 RepID=A0A1V8M1E0_9GAMM|nr:hypothetical protein AU255_17885 [Methyloprofundus sedimenti]